MKQPQCQHQFPTQRQPQFQPAAKLRHTLLAIACCAVLAPAAQAQTGNADLTFTPSAADFANPERGFFRWADTDLTQLTASDVNAAYQEGYRLLYVLVRLDKYRRATLPATWLTQLERGLTVARKGGIKVVPRFVYNYPDNETEYENARDATLDRVLAHIGQLKPVFQRNADVIAFFQAGFVGAWGEWHTSSNRLDREPARSRIRDALLDALPADRFVQFRYPGHLIGWVPTPPTEAAALSGRPEARTGMHNDCFLASDTDVGTYSEDAEERAEERRYVAALSKVAPFGGETCNPADDPSPRMRNSCADILAEGARFSLTYLNRDYYREGFHNVWQQQGCYAEVSRRMGYRIELQRIQHPTTATRGQPLNLQLTVKNVGWARLYNTRGLAVVLKDERNGTTVTLPASGADPRRWLPGSAATNTLQVTVPGSLPVGNYAVYLALPDGAATLRADPRYSVRPANADNPGAGQTWNAGLGAFRLGSGVYVN